MIVGELLSIALLIWIIHLVYEAYAKWDRNRQYDKQMKKIVEQFKEARK